MKKRMKIFVSIMMVFPLVFLTSCGGDKPIEELVADDVVEKTESQENEIYYQIPSPDEMLGFIKESGLAFNGELLNPVQHAVNYTDPKAQALNFGIYSADLAYTSVYEEFNETTKYFGTIQKLAEPIGISAAFNEKLMKRAQENLDNADSLVAITNTSYFTVIDYLEQNNQGNKLGLIAAAGWLETIYVVVNTTNYASDGAAVDRLADQKLTLENLLDYLDKYKSDEDVAEVLVWFNELEAVFATLPEEKSAEGGISFKKKDNGKMVLGGGSSISISEAQFKAIKNKVNEIRNHIVKIEA